AVLRRARVGSDGLARVPWRLVEQAAGALVSRQQCLDGGSTLRLTGTRRVQKGGTLVNGFGQRFVEQSFFAHGCISGDRRVFSLHQCDEVPAAAPDICQLSSSA